MQSLPVACAIHPDIGAVFTCQRCGCFACEDCRSVSQSTLCLPCSQRVAPAGSLTASVLLRDSFSLLGRNLSGVGLLLGFNLLALYLGSFIRHPDSNRFLVSLLSGCLSCISVAAFLSWTADGLLQQPGRSLLASLHVGMLRFVPLLLMSLLFALVVGAGTLLLILPGIYLALCMSLAPALVALEGLGPVQALNHSYQLTQGHRLALLAVFAVMTLLHVGVMLLGQLYLTLLPRLGDSPWLWMGFFVLGQAVSSALFYGTLVLAWMRVTGRVALSPDP
ncbi:hypothetical protein NR798_00115 [Archangium gephyra]|uniref:hypothetical protein n=1 Tax=Archangium gephyra TaxID=48 RepID=UPI0035D492AB